MDREDRGENGDILDNQRLQPDSRRERHKKSKHRGERLKDRKRHHGSVKKGHRKPRGTRNPGSTQLGLGTHRTSVFSQDQTALPIQQDGRRGQHYSCTSSASEAVEGNDGHRQGVKQRFKFESFSLSDDEENEEMLQESDVESEEEKEPSLPVYYPAIQGCRDVVEFKCLNRIGEGAYGVVYRAVDLKRDEIVALKCLKMEKEKEGFPITFLREIHTCLKGKHQNVMTIREIVMGSNMDKIYIVMDYVEHDLKSLMEFMKEPFLIGEIKILLQQLLDGVAHLHGNWILHRDLKTSNLLLSHNGILKIGDFGLAREYGSTLKNYTPGVVTLCYRAPELLLGTRQYSTAVDLWSVGCIFAEMVLREPLWPGKSEIDQLQSIFKDLGTPNEKVWPGVTDLPYMKMCTFTEYRYNVLRRRFFENGHAGRLTNSGMELLNDLLTYSPDKRVSAEAAWSHRYFWEGPLPISPSKFPTWPTTKSEFLSSNVMA